VTWFLIVINLSGGQPSFIPMESEHACMMAAAALRSQTTKATAACINTVEA